MRDELSAWEGLEERRGRLERKVSQWSRDKSVVDDVVQETMMRAARFRMGLREPVRLDAWMERIAWNVLMGVCSREARWGVSIVENCKLDGNLGREPDPEIELIEDVTWVCDKEVESHRVSALLEGAVRSLSKGEQHLIHLAYTKLMSPAAISAELGLRRTVVKSRLYRIRKKLRLRVSQALVQSWG